MIVRSINFNSIDIVYTGKILLPWLDWLHNIFRLEIGRGIRSNIVNKKIMFLKGKRKHDGCNFIFQLSCC